MRKNNLSARHQLSNAMPVKQCKSYAIQILKRMSPSGIHVVKTKFPQLFMPALLTAELCGPTKGNKHRRTIKISSLQWHSYHCFLYWHGYVHFQIINFGGIQKHCFALKIPIFILNHYLGFYRQIFSLNNHPHFQMFS